MTDEHMGRSGARDALLDQVRNDLDDVDAALRRLEEGTYGRCEACGVAHQRRRVWRPLPAARYCLRHRPLPTGAGPPGRAWGNSDGAFR